MGDLSEDYSVIESYTNIQGEFNSISGIQFGKVDSDYGVDCGTSRCYLGYYSDGYMESVKEYYGTFDNLRVYKITDLGETQYCLSFENEDHEIIINDCNTEVQWILYQQYISQYPEWSGDV